MGMSVGASSGSDDEVMAEINTTPLIDVMLVLLIMLIITIPIQTHAVKLDLPNTQAQTTAPPPTPPEVVRLDVDFDGTVLWNDQVLPDTQALDARLTAAAAQAVQPEIHLRPNRLARYGVVAGVLASAQRLGLNKIGIVGHEQFLE